MAKPTKNALEWTVFAVGLVLVLATLGYLVRESMRGREWAARRRRSRLGSARPSQSGWLVPVEVTNLGRTTAEDVRVPIAPGSARRSAGGGRARTSRTCRPSRSGRGG